MRIRIHEPGQRTIDYAHAELLAMEAQTAFRKAQDVLLAAQKYRQRSGGFFSTDRSRQKKLEKELDELHRAILQDGYKPPYVHLSELRVKTVILRGFLSEFSDAFPNWQEEYKTIDRILGK